jgi:hypothetical protein
MAEHEMTVALAPRDRADRPLTTRLDELADSVAELRLEVSQRTAPRTSIDINNILKTALLAAMNAASPDPSAANAQAPTTAPVEPDSPGAEPDIPVEPDGPVREGGEIRDMKDLISNLARALGACTCFGTNLGCRVCHGGGKPGWQEPERRLFDEFCIGQATEQSRPDGATHLDQE